MFVRYLRASFVSQYVLIVFIALLLWLPAFLKASEPVTAHEYSPLYALLQPFFSSVPFLSVVLAFLLMLTMAFFLNSILANYQMIGRVSSLGTYAFVTLWSLSPALTRMHPLLLAMPLVLLAVNVMFRIYEQLDNELDVFNVSFLLSLASWFFFPLISLIVWVYLSLFIMRITKVRIWLIPLIGFVTPYLFLSTYYFLQNRFIAEAKVYLNLPNIISLPDKLPGMTDLIIFGLLFLMVFKAIGVAYSSIVDNNISIRKRKGIMNAMIFSSLPVLFYQSGELAGRLLLLLPFSVYMAFSLTFIRKFFWPQLFLFLLTALAMVGNYLVLFQ